jgi:hypothetical protein
VVLREEVILRRKSKKPGKSEAMVVDQRLCKGRSKREHVFDYNFLSSKSTQG